MKERSGNEAFFKWMFTVYIPEFIESLRKAHGGYEEDGTTPKWAVVMLDGESKQMDLITTPEIHDFLMRNKIIIIKLGASCSSIQQACDVAKLFMSEKKTLQSVVYRRGDEDLETTLDEFLASIPTINTENKNRIREGIVNINYAHQLASTRSILTDGWKKTGLFPYDLDQILSQCLTVQTPEVLENIKRHMPKFVKDFTDHSQVSEEIMDKYDIPIYDDGTEKRTIRHDERPLFQRRCIKISDYGLMRARIDTIEAAAAEKERKVEKKANMNESNKNHFIVMYDCHISEGDINTLKLDILNGAYKYMLDHKYTNKSEGKRPTLPNKKADYVEALKALLENESIFFERLYENV